MLRPTIAVIACLALAACGSDRTSNESEATSGVVGNQAGGVKAGEASLLDTLTGAAGHSTLANAVNAAGLAETLSGAQPYTLFAPTDAAFAKLPAGTMNGLLAPDAKGQLTALLAAHIVPGVVTAEDLGRALDRGKGKAQLATMGGSTLTLSRDSEAIAVAGPNGTARIAGPALAGSNGVIHSLDAVLMP